MHIIFELFSGNAWSAFMENIPYSYSMNFTTNRINPKIPDKPIAPTTTFSGQIPAFQISMPNNRPIDPHVLNQIRELSNANSIPTTSGNYTPGVGPNNPNPFRARSGLWFRDILGRASPSDCETCEGAK